FQVPAPVRFSLPANTPAVVWVQTRDSGFAKKLTRRADARLVSKGVSGGFLRTFEFSGKTLAWANRLIEDYTSAERVTNSVRTEGAFLRDAFCFAGNTNTADEGVRRVVIDSGG